MDIEITLDDAYKGVKRRITVPKFDNCPKCRGTGSKDGKVVTCPECKGYRPGPRSADPGVQPVRSGRPVPPLPGHRSVVGLACPECDGRGKTQRTLAYRRGHPRGSGDRAPACGSQGAGEAGGPGEPNGDLYVVMHVKPHPPVQAGRAGPGAWTFQITFAQAALGADIEIPTLDKQGQGDVLPAGTQTDTVFRLKGLGHAHPAHHRLPGDQYVRVKIHVPEKLNQEQKEILKRFAELEARGQGLPGQVQEEALSPATRTGKPEVAPWSSRPGAESMLGLSSLKGLDQQGLDSYAAGASSRPPASPSSCPSWPSTSAGTWGSP